MTTSELHDLNRVLGGLVTSMRAAQEQDREQFELLRKMASDMADLKGDLHRHMAVEEARDKDVEKRLTHMEDVRLHRIEDVLDDYNRLKAKAGGVLAVVMVIAAGIGGLLIEAVRPLFVK